MAVSQANATVEMNISGACLQNATKSFKLSKRYTQIMVNASMLNILYRRSGGIDPKELKGKVLKGVEFVTLKKRQPEDSVLKYLLFVLKGIQNAINKGYLKEIFLLFTHPETLEPLEVYSLVLKYNTEMTKKEKPKYANLEECTLDVLRYIGNLDKFEKLPKLTRVNVELTYNDNTPLEYQPPGFKEAERPVCMRFDKKSRRMVFGLLHTGYHKIIYSCRGKALIDNMAKANVDEADEHDDVPLSKRAKLDETDKQAIQPAPADDEPDQNAAIDSLHEITETLDISIEPTFEGQEIVDENRNVIGPSKTLNPEMSISIISSDDSGSIIITPVRFSADPISCICEIDSEMFAKSDINDKEVERIACDRCRNTYHLPCHGYLAPPLYCKEFVCMKCSPYNTTDSIIRCIDSDQRRIVARCRLITYLMKKYEKPQDKLMSFFSNYERDNLMDKFIKLGIMNKKKKVDVMEIQRSANVIFNMEDSQFLF